MKALKIKTGLNKISDRITEESIPVRLVEVSEISHDFDSSCGAAKFLGLQNSVVSTYTSRKVKIIKSKITGKTYLIKKLFTS